MFETLYIIKDSKQERYYLRSSHNHMTISARSSLDDVLESLRGIVIRYCNDETLIDKIDHMDSPDLSLRNPEIMKKREEDFKVLGEEYYEEMYAVILEAMKTVKANSPVIKSIKKLQDALRKKTIEQKTIPQKTISQKISSGQGTGKGTVQVKGTGSGQGTEVKDSTKKEGTTGEIKTKVIGTSLLKKTRLFKK